jgi:ribosomal protein S27AE
MADEQLKFGIPGGTLGFVSDTTKERARAAVSKAIDAGDMVRPKKCSRCGKRRKQIVAHHDDYNKPLVIRWLCRKCHSAVHRLDTRGAKRKPKGVRIGVSLSPREYKHVREVGDKLLLYHNFPMASLCRALLLTITDYEPLDD